MTLSMRCFRLLSSMCRTSEIDGRCVHCRGSDRCEINCAATLTRSMCRSTFEDPIDVNFIIMLLYSCMRITPRVCTLVLFIFLLEITRRTRWWCLKCVIVYLARDIRPFVMYYVNGKPRSSLLIESTDSMIPCMRIACGVVHSPCPAPGRYTCRRLGPFQIGTRAGRIAASALEEALQTLRLGRAS